MFGLPGLEHDSFVGSRGRGVVSNPATLLHICPSQSPQCQPAPNGGLRAPSLSAIHVSNDRVRVTGTLPGAPAGRYLLELFGNAANEAGEAEIFIGEGGVSIGDQGTATFTVSVAPPTDNQKLRSITATVTSFDGATSPLSTPVVIQESR